MAKQDQTKQAEQLWNKKHCPMKKLEHPAAKERFAGSVNKARQKKQKWTWFVQGKIGLL